MGYQNFSNKIDLFNYLNSVIDKSWILKKDGVFKKKHYPYFYNGSYKQLLEIVLSRFTIAKIASKVTVISPTEYMKIFDKSGIDLTKYNGL
jgi:hypothetical protein